jgi:translation initiation factor IF-3
LEVAIATENTNAPVREADGPRINREIKSKEVRLINYNGENLGVVSIQEALKIAQEVGLDLIEISPQVTPPVCKVLDYGKYKYEMQKKWALQLVEMYVKEINK